MSGRQTVLLMNKLIKKKMIGAGSVATSTRQCRSQTGNTVMQRVISILEDFVSQVSSTGECRCGMGDGWRELHYSVLAQEQTVVLRNGNTTTAEWIRMLRCDDGTSW